MPPSSEQKVISFRWVFSVRPKKKPTDEIFKARLDSKGFQQKPGMDFKETFAQVANVS